MSSKFGVIRDYSRFDYLLVILVIPSQESAQFPPNLDNILQPLILIGINAVGQNAPGVGIQVLFNLFLEVVRLDVNLTTTL